MEQLTIWNNLIAKITLFFTLVAGIIARDTMGFIVGLAFGAIIAVVVNALFIYFWGKDGTDRTNTQGHDTR